MRPLSRVLLLLLLAAITAAAEAAVETDPGDSAVMHDLSKSLSAADSALAWSSSSDPCSWARVSCADGRVTAIQIGNRRLSGTLPPTLRDLSSLSRFEVQQNRISGPLPSLKGLALLQAILLHDNLFTSMPPDFFSGLTALQAVSLDNNPFDPWTLPPSLKDASTLVNFSANAVALTGRVLDLFSVYSFPSLSLLALANNQLTGPLPAGLQGLQVTSLWLNQGRSDGGGLSGTIEVIQNMTNLNQLWLHTNNFSGPLPDFSGLLSLQELRLRDNNFVGPVPPSLVALPSLQKVSLSNNLLQGPVPVFAKNVDVDMDPALESFCLPKPGDCDVRVNILLSILKSFGYPHRFADDWKGNDPCNSWLGVTCREGIIISLNFKNKHLSGQISPDFSQLTSLENILLSGNNLTGTIPESLVNLPHLNELDVSNNSLSGKVPNFSNNVVVITSGNANIGKDLSPPPVHGSGSQAGSAPNSPNGGSKLYVGIIAGPVIGGILILLLIGLISFHFYRRNNSVQSANNVVIHPAHFVSDSAPVQTPVASSSANASGAPGVTSSSPTYNHMIGAESVSIQVLRNVTNNFSTENILGKGGFGTVYKGELHDGTKIAVKRMNAGVMGSKRLREFQSEIDVLTRVRHRNLVSLLGYCLEGNERLLVYEYMPQGTLSRHLFKWKDQNLTPLNWKKRVSIALDIARGVEYMHSLAQQSFIHRDLKPSNILLGDDMKAKVADFGLVRLAPEGVSFVDTKLAGTFGYLAPEYAVTGRVSKKIDVFSYGVILMELITGQKAIDDTRPDDSVHLVNWFSQMLSIKDSFYKVVDPVIELDGDTLKSINTVAELAGHCCGREPRRRPHMGYAVSVLCSLSGMWKPTDIDSEESPGIDHNITLSQALKVWKASENKSHLGAPSSSSFASVHNTQSSIPTRPPGFADTLIASDTR